MSFRRRMVLLAAGAVAAAVVLASVVVYVATRNELIGQIDTNLRQKLTPGQPQSVRIKSVILDGAALAKLRREGRLPPEAFAPLAIGAPRSAATAFGRFSGGPGLAHADKSFLGRNVVIEKRAPAAGAQPPGRGLGAIASSLILPPQRLGGATGYAQLFQANGRVLRPERSGPVLLPVTAATRAVAAGRRPAFFGEATVAGTKVRTLTKRAPDGGVWQVALPLSDVDSTLAHLKLVLAIVSLGGIALAAALGLLVSRAALVPVRRLTGAAERVARTQDLGHRIELGGEDELARLAASFNTMLAALSAPSSPSASSSPTPHTSCARR